ncbi:MAG: DUF4139 domain-containing protein [Pseudomonadota bacterium]
MTRSARFRRAASPCSTWAIKTTNSPLVAAIALAVFAVPASPGAMAQPAGAATDLALTIYNDNLALIHDERTLSYGKGRSVVTLPGVSSQIQAPTVTFSAPGVSIIEQNFDYDLLTPSKLMEKAVGKTVKIVRTNPATGKETTQTATVLSVNRGVVLKIGDRIEVLRDDNLPTRVIFDRVPENLRADPTLSVMVEADRTERKPTSLTYLTSGLSWQADYVAAFDETAGAMDFQGWVTLSNSTETTFSNARVQMVAGDVAQSDGRGSNRPRSSVRRRSSSTRAGGTQATGEARLGDNYLYPLPGRTTVASQQTKQVGFVAADGAKAAKNYEYWAYGFNTINEPQNVDVRIAFSNSKAAGLGAALPKGIVRVYTKDAQGRSQFIGEDRIEHTAGGAELAIKIGEAFDVTVQPTVRANKIVTRRVTETTMAYTLRNAKTEPVTVTVRQQAGWSGVETEITSQSAESRNPAANQYVWSVPVPAQGETELSFTIKTKTR